ncbi:cell wall-binding repeat-containing protein [Kineococcus sp. NPDC059986]|uniref:cell wall-binding repeat-containing protein n=1 Tax=Kineococcus sp. NPDC059986 TaxID=3155538 RepID=UPI00344BDAAE
MVLVATSVLGVGVVPAQAAAGFDPGASRVAGVDRYDTAARAAVGVHGARTVVVANGETNGIDALGAAYLAGVVDGPVLLTRRDDVPATTARALAALDPETVLVLGSEASVAPATYDALTAGRAGQRIYGPDRYATAAAVAAFARATELRRGLTPVSTVLLARGDVAVDEVAADALALSPVAFAGRVPVLLTGTDDLPAATATALRNLRPDAVVVAGDEHAVSSAVLEQVGQVAGVAAPQRLAGTDRTATAVAVADSNLAAAAGLTAKGAGFANGTRVDALVAGPVLGRQGLPLLLSESRTSMGAATTGWVLTHQDTLTIGLAFGDSEALTDAVLNSIKSPASASPVG